MNGRADSIIIAELSNWNGKAVKVPRAEIQDYISLDDLSKAGIYFLFCNEDDGSPSVYIGESEDILGRLRQHLKESFYWHTVVAFTGNDLNKALIRYLEYELVIDARDCGRYKVLTKNINKTKLKESQAATMAEFIDNVKLIISAMSYNVFAPLPKEAEKKIYFYCRNKSGALAKGFVSAEGFTVLKGSTVSKNIAPSFTADCDCKLRKRLEDGGIISGGVFKRNYEFKSPSAASSVVLGHTSSGKTDWKTEDGTTLGNI